MSAAPRSAILGLGTSVPAKILTNEQLAGMVDTTDDWIVSRTGIRERRILAEGESLSDHGVAACQRAIEHAGLQLADIDLLMVSTYTPERMCPSASCEIHLKMEMGSIPAMDVNAACSGFLYILHIADNLIRAGAHKNILIVGLEGQSRFVDYTDRGTCILFGDGAGAVVVGRVDDNSGRGVYSTCLGADGRGAELIRLENCPPADPSRANHTAGCPPFIRMQGREVFKFAVRMVGQALDEALEKAGMQPSQVDLLVPHQANIRIIQAAAERLSLPPERVLVNIEKYGNTASASIPLALADAVNDGHLKKGMTVALVGFGAGFTYGSAVIKW